MNSIGTFYASRIYPGLSAALSWLASPFPFSLTELLVAILLLLALWLLVRIIVRPKRGKNLLRLAGIALLTYVWFYGAWGLNYFRSDIYARTGTAAMPYEEAEFRAFLEEFAEQLNGNWCPAAALATLRDEDLEPAVKAWYAALPPEAGLCKPRSWQHPKRLLFNRLYSAVGVLGFIGPAFDEMHINQDITPIERPFVFAHEYAHVLGVSSEAEANFWAFEAARHNDNQAVRYSAWYSLLSFTWRNIHALLGEADFHAWTATIRPEIFEDMQRTQEYWQARRWPWLSRLQHRFYNFFLRSNRIADGTKNYGQVLRLVLSLSDLHDHEEDGEER